MLCQLGHRRQADRRRRRDRDRRAGHRRPRADAPGTAPRDRGLPRALGVGRGPGDGDPALRAALLDLDALAADGRAVGSHERSRDRELGAVAGGALEALEPEAHDAGERRRGELRGAAADRGQLRVERVAGAGGAVAVAVARDALERHRRAGRVAVLGAAGGLDDDLAGDGHAVQPELPGQEPGDRLERLGRGRHVTVRADDRHAGRAGVVALRLRADDRLVDASGAALEDLAVAVDEEVVAQVVPAVGVAVVLRDAEDDPRRVLRRVVVRRDGVVDEADLHLAVARFRAGLDAVPAPLRAGDDRGRPGLGRATRPGGRRGACRARGAGAAALGERTHGDEVHLQRAPRTAGGAQLELVGATGPDRIGGVGAGAGVRPVRRAVAEGDPGAPGGAALAHPDLEPAEVAAAHADDVEAPRRAQRAGAAALPEVGRGHAEREAARAHGGGRGRRGSCGDGGEAGETTGRERTPTRQGGGGHRVQRSPGRSPRKRCHRPCRTGGTRRSCGPRGAADDQLTGVTARAPMSGTSAAQPPSASSQRVP